MRNVVHATIVGVIIAVAFCASAFAGETRKSRVFKEPPLGLGADIPDTVLFNGGSAEGPGNGHGFAVRKKQHLSQPGVQAPILDGWEVDDIEVADSYGWQAGEPVRAGCLASDAIMAGLLQAGWSNFTRLSLRSRTIAFNARRRDGRAKRVQVDRCTGEIIHVSASYSR